MTALRPEVGSCAPPGRIADRGVLIVCSANRCRSPMAAALLRRHLAAGRGPGGPADRAGSQAGPGAVISAGLDGPPGLPPPAEVLAVMAPYGLDLGAHRAVLASPAHLAAADLIVTMTREQLRTAVVMAPAAWPRAFTLPELARRAAQAGHRAPGETVAGWLDRVQDGRRRAAMLGERAADDVADPIGGPMAGYRQAAALLDELTGQLAALGWPAQLSGACPQPG